MNQIKLNGDFALGTETCTPGRLRLIVFKNQEVWVCRKESAHKLNQFITAAEAHAFKGRLQLYKQAPVISVRAKGQIIGQVSVSDFKGLF